jgi:hypothetical protein
VSDRLNCLSLRMISATRRLLEEEKGRVVMVQSLRVANSLGGTPTA